MGIYWIDSGVLISAKNTLYAPELVPAFWTFIETQLKNGNVRMPKKCFDEVVDGNDWLAKWCKQRKNIGHFCCKSGRDAQQRYEAVAEFVMSKHSQHASAEFLRGGDGWVIAHAAATGGFVVTEELRNKNPSKVKIPNVSKALRIPWKATHEMCKELGGFGNV